MPFKFGDGRFGVFGLAEGQGLHFPIYFEGRPYYTHTIITECYVIPDNYLLCSVHFCLIGQFYLFPNR